MYISEYGVYHLAMKCQLPIGEKFREWIAEELVPTIWKTGQYKLHKQIADQGKQLAIQDQKILKLCEKVAVMTLSNETKHVFQLYKHQERPNHYLFNRRQSRSLSKAMRAGNIENYDILLNEVNDPNSMNIINRLKEKFRSSKNTLRVDADVLGIVGDLIEESRT